MTSLGRMHYQGAVLDGASLVRQAVRTLCHVSMRPQVFWLGGALHARDVKVIVKLRELAQQHSGIVALLDPDPAGRQGRAALETAFGSACLHAFVPGFLAFASAATR